MNRQQRRNALKNVRNKLDDVATDTLARFLCVPCITLFDKYGWTPEQIQDFAASLSDVYGELCDNGTTIDDMQKYLSERCGVVFIREDRL